MSKPFQHVEALACATDLALDDVVSSLGEHVPFDSFDFDAENETEWASAELDWGQLNISRPYETGTLYEWDESTPEGATVAILLMLARPRDGDVAAQAEQGASLARRWGQWLADALGCEVVHHRTSGAAPREGALAVFRPR
jgi:hypothetical protein